MTLSDTPPAWEVYKRQSRQGQPGYVCEWNDLQPGFYRARWLSGQEEMEGKTDEASL